MVIDICGTNGSGKSTIVRTILTQLGSRKLYGVCGIKQPEAYGCIFEGEPLFILGSYERVTGGVDNIQPYELILDLTRKYVAKGHVLLEGVVASGAYGRLKALLSQLKTPVVLLFMDTSLEVCIANTKKRRGARGEDKEFNPTNLTKKYNQMPRQRELSAEKFLVKDISMDNGVKTVLNLLRENPLGGRS